MKSYEDVKEQNEKETPPESGPDYPDEVRCMARA